VISAVVVAGHGTVESLDELPAFLANIRRGKPAPPELEAEVRRHYEAIGGRSPLGDICAEVARKLEARLRVPVRFAARLWPPYPKEVLAELAKEGVSRVAVVPLAQHSAKVYGDAVAQAARELAEGGGSAIEVVCADNWGRSETLTRAFAREARDALANVPPAGRSKTTLLLTAHSLPLAVIRAGDPYEREVRASAEAVVRALGADAPTHVAVAFQSQGLGHGEWLGPDLKASLDAVAGRGNTHVVVAPVGFLADHVEILYDLDIDARRLAAERGLTLTRTRSLNASDGLLDALEGVARPLLGLA